ncbi:hypothetical protein [Cumulibacter manganitolerans]|uniref:hypothetical protein n=1 Tax=Cumulibacter manganitolerans TaxID=1884992 RepID=UPI0012976BBF|nr:hypothetical protein [Cumulibacter manganitolerans]
MSVYATPHKHRLAGIDSYPVAHLPFEVAPLRLKPGLNDLPYCPTDLQCSQRSICLFALTNEDAHYAVTIETADLATAMPNEATRGVQVASNDFGYGPVLVFLR